MVGLAGPQGQHTGETKVPFQAPTLRYGQGAQPLPGREGTASGRGQGAGGLNEAFLSIAETDLVRAAGWGVEASGRREGWGAG